MINILVRTSYRPKSFKILLDSIQNQTFKNIRIIIGYDDDRALSYIPKEIESIRLHKDLSKPFFYDNYCNVLKNLVKEGWFVFIDDDDILLDNTSLERLNKELKGKDGIICQFSRGGRLKPSNEQIKNHEIRRSKIGMPCLILHQSHKNMVDFDGSVGAADYTWIKKVSRKIKLKFVPIVLSYSHKRGYGTTE
jgi:hypothetical protein